jgi:hypothetical protein
MIEMNLRQVPPVRVTQHHMDMSALRITAPGDHE